MSIFLKQCAHFRGLLFLWTSQNVPKTNAQFKNAHNWTKMDLVLAHINIRYCQLFNNKMCTYERLLIFVNQSECSKTCQICMLTFMSILKLRIRSCGIFDLFTKIKSPWNVHIISKQLTLKLSIRSWNIWLVHKNN